MADLLINWSVWFKHNKNYKSLSSVTVFSSQYLTIYFTVVIFQGIYFQITIKMQLIQYLCVNFNASVHLMRTQPHNTLMEKKPHLTHNTWRLQQEVNRIAGETRYSREEKPADKIQPSQSLPSVQHHLLDLIYRVFRNSTREIFQEEPSKFLFWRLMYYFILTKMTLADIYNQMTTDI